MPGKTDPSNPCENRSLPGGLAEKPIGIQDWSETGLGPVSTWPDSLKNLLSVALHSGEPVCIAWGDDLVCLYNEAFHTLIDRRASSPGQSLDKLLAPLWSLLSETVECALRGTEAKASGLPLALLRNETDDGSLPTLSAFLSKTPKMRYRAFTVLSGRTKRKTALPPGPA